MIMMSAILSRTAVPSFFKTHAFYLQWDNRFEEGEMAAEITLIMNYFLLLHKNHREETQHFLIFQKSFAFFIRSWGLWPIFLEMYRCPVV